MFLIGKGLYAFPESFPPVGEEGSQVVYDELAGFLWAAPGLKRHCGFRFHELRPGWSIHGLKARAEERVRSGDAVPLPSRVLAIRATVHPGDVADDGPRAHVKEAQEEVHGLLRDLRDKVLLYVAADLFPRFPRHLTLEHCPDFGGIHRPVPAYCGQQDR